MAAVDTVFIVNFLLNIAIAVTGIIIAMLIPSSRKIRDGEAGTQMGSNRILFVLVLMVIISISVFPISLVFLEGRNLYFGLALDLIAILVTILAVREFFSARKAYRELDYVEEVGTVAISHPQHHPHTAQHAVHHAEELHPEVHPHGHTAQSHSHHGSHITVECPQCGRHIQIAEGSHAITCPYCGLSGTI
jgi:hypothetical protein